VGACLVGAAHTNRTRFESARMTGVGSCLQLSLLQPVGLDFFTSISDAKD
jgi:hypothetical protein